jgi:acyl-CoA oxidase
MSPKPNPDWVQKLTPSSPQGVDLLQAERDKSNISVEKLSNFLFTKEALERRDQILEVLKNDKVFDKSQNYFDGRVERWQTALARAKRLRQLQVKHNWSMDDYTIANELMSEPGPYGLHSSMYLVGLSESLLWECAYNLRQHCVIKEHQNNTSSSLSRLKTTNTLDVMRRPSLGMVRTSEDWRLLPPGTQRTAPLSCIRHISRVRNGGLEASVELQIMQW